MWHLEASAPAALPALRAGHYSDLLALRGHELKREPHTIIRLLDTPSEQGDCPGTDLVLKQYRYSGLSQCRSWHRISKAQREYETLMFCREHGIPAVEPLGFGAQRSILGAIRSCFVLTRYEQGVISLRDGLRARGDAAALEDDVLRIFLGEAGGHLRTAHAEHFYFFSLLAKNILVRPGVERLEWFIIDQCYARRLKHPALAAWAQALDIGMFLGSVAKYSGIAVDEAFFSSYLPDPLEGSESALRRRVAQATRSYLKQTPMRRVSGVIEAEARHVAAGFKSLCH